jgi:hypothetical protein
VVAVTPTVEWTISPKQLAAFEKRVERYRGLPLAKRMAKGELAAAQYLAKYIKAGTPVGKTGNLKASVRARQGVASAWGQQYRTVQAFVGPTRGKGNARHLVILGHRIIGHEPNKVDTGKRSKPNPFVDNAVRGHSADAFRIINRILFAATP